MDILLSVKSKYLKRIYAGTKSIEIRKQVPRKLKPRDIIWFYESGKGAVTGLARFYGYKIIAPKQALVEYGSTMGVTNTEFWNYVGNSKKIVLLGFTFVSNFDKGLPLSAFGLKRAPQSYCYVED